MARLGKKPCAYHEAGHAVVARLLGWRVGRAALQLKPYTRGFIALGPPKGCLWSDPEMRMPNAIIALAGHLAELFHRPLSDRAFNHAWDTAWGQDIEAAGQAIANLKRPLKAFDSAYERARRLVADNWDAIDRVAKALLKHRRLTAKQIDALIEGESA